MPTSRRSRCRWGPRSSCVEDRRHQVPAILHKLRGVGRVELFTRLRQDAVVAKKRQKSPVSAAEQELKAAVKKLRTQLAAAEKSAEKWRSRAKSSKTDAAGLK